MGIDVLPATVSRLVSQKNRGCEPPSSPPSHSPRNLSPLCICSVPFHGRRRSHLHSRADQTDLLFYWSQVHEVISVFRCNLGCTGTPALCRDAQRTILDIRKKEGMCFPKASRLSQSGKIENELLKPN